MRGLHRALLGAGVVTTLTDAGRDLGIDAIGGGRRRQRVAAAGVALARQRAWRVVALCGANLAKHARSLTKTGVLPQAVWGAPAGGCSPSQVERIRRIAATGLGCTGAGRCLTTAIAMRLGV